MCEARPYKHTQRAPLCVLLYAIGIVFLWLSWLLRKDPVAGWVFLVVAPLMLVLAAAFHHLTVEDEGDRLSIRFGPLPLFRHTIPYTNMTSVKTGRTTLMDGWGIHMHWGGGWTWNLWGRDCVVLMLKKGSLRIGTDDADRLAAFLNSRVSTGTCERSESMTSTP